VVFVIMLERGSSHRPGSLATEEGEEEERRLFYVAVTRARNELYLSHPWCAPPAHARVRCSKQPSRFLAEIPADLREEWNLRPHTAYNPPGNL